MWCMRTRSISKCLRLAGILAAMGSFRASPLSLLVFQTWALNSIMLWLTYSLTSDLSGLGNASTWMLWAPNSFLQT